MRRAKKILSFLFVLLIIGLSLSMPKMVFQLQQQKRYSETKTYPIELIELKAASKLQDCLRLVGGTYTALELSAGETLNSTQAQEAAETAMEEFLPVVFPQFDKLDFEPLAITPRLALSDDRAVSAVIWQCQFTDEYGRYINLLLDDNTGLLLAFQMIGFDSFPFAGQGSDTKVTYYKAPADSPEMAYALGQAAADHYGFTLDELKMEDDSDLMYGLSCTISLKDDNGELLECSLFFDFDTVLFNSGSEGVSSASVAE